MNKKYIIVKDRHPYISEVLNDCVSLCVPTSKNEPLSSILQKICNKIKDYKVGNTSSIDLTLSGTTITGNVNISEDNDNCLEVKDDGLYVECVNDTGEVNTASNIGAGEGIFAQKSGVDLQFKSLVEGSNITITADGDEITISAAGGGGSSEIALVEDYTALRAYAGTADIIIVIDPRTQGVFYKDSTGTENGGTIIVGTYIWKRVIQDTSVFRPEWWEIGGYDINGLPYDRLTGEGIGAESDAIINCVLFAGENSTILYQNREYLLDRYVPIINNQKHLGPCTIKRDAPYVTTLTSNVAQFAVSIPVADASGFRVGQKIAIKGTTGYFGNNSVGASGDDGNVISSISGNTLTLATGIQQAMTSGQTVTTVNELFYRENSIYGVNPDNIFITFENITFDGNRDDNDYYNDYQLNANIAHFSGYITAINCDFNNSAQENIYIAGGNFQNCRYDNLFGSFIHFSDNQQSMPSHLRRVTVKDCIGKTSNVGGSLHSGHSEALFTSSTKSSLCIIDNCSFEDGSEFIFATYVLDDDMVKVRNSVFRNFLGIGTFRGMNYETPDTRASFLKVEFDNNEFYNCGILEIFGQDIRSKEGIFRVDITNNYFENSRLLFASIAHLNFSGNKVVMNPDTFVSFYEYIPYSRGNNSVWGGNGAGTVLNISALMDRVRITNNYFSGFPTSVAETVNGINVGFDNTYVRKDGASDTQYTYCQDMIISGNTIENFRYALIPTSYTSQVYFQTVGWRFENNTVYMTRDTAFASDYSLGIGVPPGCVAENNTIWTHFTNNYAAPIAAIGIKNNGSGNETKLLGAIVLNNRVWGKSNYPIWVAPFDTSPYNCIVKGNLFNYGAINIGVTATANCYLTDNTLIDNTKLASYTAPETSVYRNVSENYINY